MTQVFCNWKGFLLICLFSIIFLAVPGLLCCAWTFPSCREQGPLSSCSVWAAQVLASCCRARALGVWPAGAAACGLSSAGSAVVHMGLVVPQQVGFPWVRDGTDIPCIAMCVLKSLDHQGSPGRFFNFYFIL